jgi:PIN domain nuclease of toxin-antitoxin system
MKVLIDTHVFLSWAREEHRLSRRALTLLENPESDLVFSMASVWEAALKFDRLGITNFEALIARATQRLRLSFLAVDLRHIVHSTRLPFHHRDPFDRMLIAQASLDGIAILTPDAMIARYPVPVIW